MDFRCDDGSEYRMYHEQDCCEYVEIKEIHGDITDLIDSPIISAEESSQDGSEEDSYETSTWTFYKFRTNKGSVDITWFGESNGYYSERVDFVQTKEATQ